VTSTTQVKYGSASTRFPGSASITAGSGYDLSGAFTIEMWLWVDGLARAGEILVSLLSGSSNNYVYIAKNGGGTIGVSVGPGAGNSALAITANAWNHVAVTRNSSNVVNIYINGVKNGMGSGQFTVAYSPLTSRVLSIGNDASVGNSLIGYIDDLRITTGVAVYNSTFTPPTVEYPGSYEPNLWSASSAYISGDLVRRNETKKIYQSLSPTATVDASLPEVSVVSTVPLWREIGYVNKFKMFDYVRNQASTATGTLVTTISKADRIGSVAMVNMVNVANIKVEVSVSSVYTTIYDVPNDYEGEEGTEYYSTRIFDALPPYYDSPIRVTLTSPTGTEVISIQALMFGFLEDLGDLQNGLSLDATNFSVVRRDTFGNAELVRRRNIPRISGTVMLKPEQVNRISKLRDSLNAKPALWVGLENPSEKYYNSLALIGVYKVFSFSLDNPIAVEATIEIEEI
jgi:hypothetical protein